MNSSQKTILNIVILYLSITILLLLSLSYIYYDFAKNSQFNTLKQQSKLEADTIIKELEYLHNRYRYGEFILYPSIQNKSAIYDIDKNLLYSEFNKTIPNLNLSYYQNKNFLYFIYKVEPHYLGANYLVIEEKLSLDNIKNKIFIALLFIILFLILTSFIIAKLLIQPLDNQFKLLDNFIKDTTHELNTPISTILANIEMLDYSTLTPSNQKKINRIKIASTTISTIYDDLSFLLLNKYKKSNNTNIDISNILKQRLEFFKILLESKKLHLEYKIEKNVILFIDEIKIQRLFDNLISNAIKYSYPNSNINIVLTKDYFIIEDFGKGIDKKDLKKIFIRYKRFDNSTGGFGIGYSIIKSIVDEYNMQIEIDSKLNKGTKVTIKWQK